MTGRRCVTKVSSDLNLPVRHHANCDLCLGHSVQAAHRLCGFSQFGSRSVGTNSQYRIRRPNCIIWKSLTVIVVEVPPAVENFASALL